MYTRLHTYIAITYVILTCHIITQTLKFRKFSSEIMHKLILRPMLLTPVIIIRVKLTQFSIKIAEKRTDKNHNIAPNKVGTQYRLLPGPEHYQLTTNAIDPNPLVLSI